MTLNATNIDLGNGKTIIKQWYNIYYKINIIRIIINTYLIGYLNLTYYYAFKIKMYFKIILIY